MRCRERVAHRVVRLAADGARTFGRFRPGYRDENVKVTSFMTRSFMTRLRTQLAAAEPQQQRDATRDANRSTFATIARGDSTADSEKESRGVRDVFMCNVLDGLPHVYEQRILFKKIK